MVGTVKALAKTFPKRIANGELCYPYVNYPYIEWYSCNGRAVLELRSEHVEIFDGEVAFQGKTIEEPVFEERSGPEDDGRFERFEG